MHGMQHNSAARSFGGLGVLLVGLTFACGPSAAPINTPAAGDAFAVVRATSQAAYQAGQGWLDRGDIVQGCPLIDTARTTDPDNRPEIQHALDRCLVAITQMTPEASPTPGQRTTVIGTLALVAPLGTASTTQTPPSRSVAASTPVVAVPQATSASGVASQPTAQATTALSLVAWRDPQARFSLSAPAEWATLVQPGALFGTGVVQFRDPNGRAEVNVAVDSAAKAVSPELYAASMEIAMQQQVPGYAGEQFVPGSTSGQPSVRRVFTFTQGDAAGKDLQARSFQVTVLKGSTPYIISGSSPADQFEHYLPTFDQMVETFHFS